jgi:CRISPR-associated endonuclease/helicase Cas3
VVRIGQELAVAAMKPANSNRVMLHAHTPNGDGTWHKLSDHLLGTATLAGEFAQPFGGGAFSKCLGLLHDVGKSSCVFSSYLDACAAEGDEIAKARYPHRDHKAAGALTASRIDDRWGVFAALAILGHHGGMPDLQEARGRLEVASQDATVEDALQRAARYLEPDLLSPSITVPRWLEERPSGDEAQRAHARDVEMFVRMAFSSLVDADWLDTESHFDSKRAGARAAGRDLASLLDRCDRYRSALVDQAADTAVNRVRGEIYEATMETAGWEPGLYQLSAPTGAGKTLLGLEWGLRHAHRHSFQRLITAVPFISVTDQVADVYRSVLEDSTTPVVLEHHSQVVDGKWWQRLAAENWDAPVVVTTTVRLFESLFSNRPSDCRRLHRLARSVIVLDEVQALPLEMIEPIVDALHALVTRFGATVVLMTATQPTLERVRSSRGEPAVPLLEYKPEWDAVFARTERRVASTTLTVDQLTERLGKYDQFLCVMNSIPDAEAVTRSLVADGDADILHLSTRLRPADRRERLRSIRELLGDGRPCRVVSTQLVEAGVDLDFPVVYRAMAPLPSLVQADGRCNRHGLLPGKGETVVFDLVNAKLPTGSYYRVGTPLTRVLLASRDLDAWSLDGIRTWYERLFEDGMVTTDKSAVQEKRDAFSYRAVADAFKMIDDDTYSVVVPWPPSDSRAGPVDKVLSRLADGDPVGPGDYRVLQDATITLGTWRLRAAVSLELAKAITPNLYMWKGEYDMTLGLQMPPRTGTDS